MSEPLSRDVQYEQDLGEGIDPVVDQYPRPWETYQEASETHEMSRWAYASELLKLALSIPFTAFSKDVREVIFHRDNAECQSCDHKWSSGWMLHCAHNDGKHDRRNPDYNNSSSGCLLCVDCHQEQHERLLHSAKQRGDRYEIQRHSGAVSLLSHTDRRRRGYGNPVQRMFSVFAR